MASGLSKIQGFAAMTSNFTEFTRVLYIFFKISRRFYLFTISSRTLDTLNKAVSNNMLSIIHARKLHRVTETISSIILKLYRPVNTILAKKESPIAHFRKIDRYAEYTILNLTSL